MLFIKLDTVETVNGLISICEKFKNNYDIVTDVVHGRYTVDGCSLLGVMSLMGKIVKVEPVLDDTKVADAFTDSLIRIGGFTN